MKTTRIKKTEASKYGGVIFVSLILLSSVITFATPIMSENLPPKTIYGTASRCDSASVSGASVHVSSSLGSRSTACSGTGSWSFHMFSPFIIYFLIYYTFYQYFHIFLSFSVPCGFFINIHK